MTTKQKRKSLYTWNWIGGGYNQCFASSREEAEHEARTMSDKLVPNMSTFKECDKEQAQAWWDNMPLFD